MNTVAKNLSYLACLCLICCGAMLLAGCGGTMDVTSINITKAGTYYVKFCDLTGHYVFYEK